jgi:hypothetical protein
MSYPPAEEKLLMSYPPAEEQLRVLDDDERFHDHSLQELLHETFLDLGPILWNRFSAEIYGQNLESVNYKLIYN